MKRGWLRFCYRLFWLLDFEELHQLSLNLDFALIDLLY